MGRKHLRKGQHIYFCIATLIILFLTGCSTAVINPGSSSGIDSPITQQKFKILLEENQKILFNKEQNSSKDMALFNIGLLYAHADNPDRDYIKSIAFFRKLINEYPDSNLVTQAGVFISLLDKLNEMQNKLDKITTIAAGQFVTYKLLEQGQFKTLVEYNKEILSDKKKDHPKDNALFYLGLAYAHPDNPEKNYRKSVTYFNRLVREYPESQLNEHAKIWVNILNIIEKTKQIDIEIEKKKKELSK